MLCLLIGYWPIIAFALQSRDEARGFAYSQLGLDSGL